MTIEQRILQSIPLLAPIPTAWMVYSACVNLLEFPVGIAIPAALVVEGLGFASIRLANQMREYNRHLNAIELKQRMQAPSTQAYSVAGLYVIVVLVMTTVLHIYPSVAIFAPVPFVFMSVAGAWLWSLYSDQISREGKWLEGRTATHLRRTAKASDALIIAPATNATHKRRTSATLYRCECGFTTDNRYKLSGHKRYCGTYQEMKSGQPIPIKLGHVPVDLARLEKLK